MDGLFPHVFCLLDQKVVLMTTKGKEEEMRSLKCLNLNEVLAYRRDSVEI